MDFVGPLAGAVVFVLVMSALREPMRHRLNVLLVAGASGVYISGGLGTIELLFSAIVLFVVYRGFTSYRFIGIAWLLHASWDLVHHLYAHPIWPFMPTSSFGCLLFDSAIAIWFLAGAPTIWRLGRAVPAPRAT